MKLKCTLISILIFVFSTIVMAGQPVKINPLNTIKINNHGSMLKTTWIAMQFKKLTIQMKGDSLSWSAIVKNNGPRLQANRVQIKAMQLMVKKPIADAGAPAKYRYPIKRGQTMNFGRQGWRRAPSATHLKVEFKDLQTGRFISKTIMLPDKLTDTSQGSNTISQVEGMNQDLFLNPTQNIVITGAEYRGRGRFKIRIKNTGNTGISANQLKITPIFYVSGAPRVLGDDTSNPASIKAGGQRWIYGGGGGIYYKDAGECWVLHQLQVQIVNTVTKQLVYQHIDIPTKPQGKIINFSFYTSLLTYTIKNTGTYRTKFKIQMQSVVIRKQRKYNDQQGKKIGNMKNAFPGYITLNPGETGNITISQQRVNSELKSTFSNLTDGYYFARNFKLILLTDDMNPYCHPGKGKQLNHYQVSELKQASSTSTEINLY